MSGIENEAARIALRDARAAWERGDAARAETRCRDALAADADNPRAWILLAVVLRTRRPGEARAALEAALERSPKHPDAWFQLGNLHRQAGRYREAVAAYENAALAAPANPALQNNLGLALEGVGEPVRAEAAYRSALAHAPGHRQSLGNLAHLLCNVRRFSEAGRLCEEYLQRYPDADATIWVDRGICRHHAGDGEGATKSFAQALELAPDDPIVLSNLGSVLADEGEFEHAEAVLARVVAHNGPLLYATSLLAHCQAQLCKWDKLDALHATVRCALEGGTGGPINAFAALSMPLPPSLQLAAALRWASDLRPRASDVAQHRRLRRAGTVRVGYVSSDFRVHATPSLLAEVWERHDRARLSIYAYSIGPSENSALRARIEAAFDRFVDCVAMDGDDVAQQIRSDGIDVLVDLNGYTRYARSEIFALRAAPVQVSWLGYLGTLGAPWYDYVLADRFVAPPQLQRFFTESFLYLPDCYCPSDTKRPIASVVPSRAGCGLPEGGFVFSCFNQSYKILPKMFSLWMRLLATVPGSVLWLSPESDTARSNLRREAAMRGIDPERLVFAPRVALPEHLARHAHADLFLDTAPYNAGAACNDALFMGVPVLTCSGQTMASRVAGSQLTAIGLPELITSDLEEYEALAIELATNRERLLSVRTRLAANRQTHPLFDMARFARALDAVLLAVSENRPGPRRS